MGFNEPYFEGKEGYIIPADAVEYWRKYFQPVSDQTGLDLVSMTTAVDKVEWMADFLKQCYSLSNLETLPCNVHSLKIFSIHNYNCSESFWRHHYDGTRP